MDMRACISRHYFSPESVPGGISCTCEPRPEVDEGVNACLGEAVEKCKNAGTDVALEGVSAGGTDADGFT
jgi:hypothetical protein